MSESEIITEDTPEMITRREAVLRVSALLGGAALIGGSAFITGCRDEGAGTTAAGSFTPFTTDEIAFLDEVADTILPTTSTPGAKAAKTGAFMALIVTDSYNAGDQKAFRDGMKALDDRSREMNKVSFMESTPQQRLSLLEIMTIEHNPAQLLITVRNSDLVPNSFPYGKCLARIGFGLLKISLVSFNPSEFMITACTLR